MQFLILLVLLTVIIHAVYKAAATVVHVAPHLVSHYVSKLLSKISITVLFATLLFYAARPDPPTILGATVLSPQSVKITWLRPSSNYYQITGYRVHYSSLSEVATLPTTLSHTFNNLMLNRQYTFYVRSNSLAGLSSASSTTVTIGEGYIHTTIYHCML